MIPRFSIYADVETWSGDIQGDPIGMWTRWNAVEPYVTYALEHGYEPPVEIVAEQTSLPMFDEWFSEQMTTPVVEDMESPGMTIDSDVDVYDMITGQAAERFDDEV